MKKTLLLNYLAATPSRNPRKNTTRFNGLLALFVMVMGMGVSWGQIVAWNPTTPTSITGYGSSPFAPTTANNNLTVVGLTRGSGLGTVNSAAASAWGGTMNTASVANSAAAILANQFITFSITPNTGYTTSLSNFDLFYRRSSSGPASGTLQYSIGTGTYSDISTLSFSNSSSSGASITQVSLSGISALQAVAAGNTINFRINLHGNGAANGTFYIFSTGLQIGGTVVASGKTVTFNNNGGTGTMANQTASTATNLTSNSFTRTGYTFSNWNTTANGSGTSYDNNAIYSFSADATLYAQWAANITPSLTAGLLSSYPNTCTNTTSGTINSFSLSGSNLTSDVNIGSLIGFSYCLTSSGVYSSSLTLSPVSNSISQTIYVKFTPTAVQSYNGNIAISGGGATSINVSVAGSGINSAPSITTPTSASITTISVILGGNITDLGCNSVTTRGVELSTANGFINGTGTIFSETGTFSTGTFTINASGLSSGTTYYYKAFATSTSGTAYTSQGTFTTSPPVAPVASSASAVGATSFTANWNTVSGATNYRLDVMTTLINQPFINEFHYDNINTDSGEFVEIIVPNSYSGVNLKLLLYNGNGGAVYDTKTLSELTLGSSSANYKIYSYTYSSGIQNGSPDGFALSDDSGVIEFLSYEGTFAGTDGPAIGLTSIDVGVAQTGDATNDPVGGSVQKTGSFGNYNWVVTQQNTIGVINSGQSINDTYVTGFENLNVGNVITYNVSGLNQNTTYFYRIRSVIGSGTSLSSNVITVQTPIVSTTWNGTAWSNGSPSNTVDAIIDGNLVTSSDLACKDLTINANRTLTIAAGYKLTVSGNLINNGTIVFKSNASATAMFGAFNGTQSGTGVVTTERYIPSGKRAFRLLSPAVTTSNFISGNWQQQTHITGGASGGFDITETNNPSMYTYNNQVANGTGWEAITNTNATNLTAGVGYRMLVRGDRTTTNITAATTDNMNAAITLSATGTLRTGTVTLNASSTPAINNQTNATTANYSLVGNPYQSAVDWNAVTKSGIDGSYYAWDPNMGTTGVQRGRYVVFNGTTNDNVSSQVGRYIQPGQAFFVKNTVSGTAGTLTFQEAHKATTNANVFRTANQTESANFASLSMQLYDPNELALGGYPIDATKAVFSSDYSNELGLGDATKLEAAGENIAWFRNNTKLAIDAAAPVTTSDELVMKTLRLGANKNYTFKIQTTNFDTALTPYLVDNFLNTQTEITTSQAFLASFATTSNVASYSENRFKVVFSPSSALSNDQWNAKSLGIYPNPVVENQFTIDVSSSITDKVTITIYNIIGQSVYKVSATPINNSILVQPNVELKAGVYMVEMTNNGKTNTQKIIVK